MKRYKFRFAMKFICVCAAAAWLLAPPVAAQPHLVVMSHREDVNKAITVYDADGDLLLKTVTTGGVNNHRPRFISVSPLHYRFLVTAPNLSNTGAGAAYVFDYSGYPNPGGVGLHAVVATGAWPFHTATAPDGRFAVACDAANRVDLIHPGTLAVQSIPAGATHSTLCFAKNASGAYLFAVQFPGDENPHPFPGKTDHDGEHGSVDVVDLATGLVVANVALTLPVPHSLVYSPLTDNVYVSCEGGLEIIEAKPPFDHQGTIEAPKEETLAPAIKISPNGRFIVGIASAHEHEHDAALYFLKQALDEDSEPYLWVYDLVNDTSQTIDEFVHCQDFAYSPDGRWIVAGSSDAHDGHPYEVAVVQLDTTTGDLAEVERFDIDSALAGIDTDLLPARVGLFGADFSPDSTRAYLSIVPTDITPSPTDQVMVVDVSGYPGPIAVSFFDCEPGAEFLKVAEVVATTSVAPSAWQTFE